MNAVSTPPRALSTVSDRYDVMIMGGGIAGLTLALQLSRTQPGIRVIVAERALHPVAEAAHKVGESSVEVQAHYLRDVLGLEEHLDAEQLRKFGLRMFFSHEGNTDITRRVEYGQVGSAPLPAYQLDRGRLENMLGQLVASRGVDFVSDCRVLKIDLRPEQDQHAISLQQGDTQRRIEARWVVDATGRSALLKRKLGLAKKVEHQANAAWLRVDHPIDVNDWAEDREWGERIPDRRLSTNHLMGPGYWVWLIPLPSGSTSIGIVADEQIHPFGGYNRRDRALEWLREHEPQCAQAIEAHSDEIQDFRVMKDYAYGCEQVFSADRWCLTGEAGVSVDPLYSAGGDLMAISNGMISDLIGRDLQGEDVGELAVGHNQVYLVLADVWLLAYKQQYPLMGNPQVMVAKVIWDTIIYWAFPGLLYFHDKLRRLADSPGASMNLMRCWTLHARVQAFFREWHALENPAASDTFADPYELLEFLVDLHTGMAAGLEDEQLEVQFAANVRLLEQLSGQLVCTVVERLSVEAPSEAARRQIEEWHADRLLANVIDVYRADDLTNPIDASWITLGSQTPELAR